MDQTKSQITDLSLSAVTDSSKSETIETVPPSTGQYVFRDEIARGGMGTVFRATDTRLNREVAVKFLQAKFGPDSGAARRFADEARITGQLQHPGIPPVHDLGTLPDGRPFLAMKLIKGTTLDSILKQRTDATTDRGRFLAIFEHICQAVAYAHAHKVIHRDLKPANIMVGAFGEVQVMDWGLAKVLGSASTPHSDPELTVGESEIRTERDSDGTQTQAGSVLGTPAFMPPEQAVGAIGKINTWSDVFGLGAVLAVILTGKPPYAAGSVDTTRVKAAQGDVSECFSRLDSCGADPEWVDLCKRCLAPKPADRPTDAGEVAQTVAGLRQAADERARQAELDRVKAEGDRAAAQLEARVQQKRRQVQLMLAAGVLLLAFGGGFFAWWQDRQASRQQAERTKNDNEKRTAELQKQFEREQQAAADRERQGRNRDAFLADLEKCEAALRDGNAEPATAALRDAIKRQAEGGTEEFDSRLQKAKRELAFLNQLDRINELGWTPFEGKLLEWSVVAKRWEIAFAEYLSTPVAELAPRIRDSLIRNRILASLEMWLAVTHKRHIAVILHAADPDEFRDEVRTALKDDDTTRAVELAETKAALLQPPRFVVALASVQGVSVERRRALLGQAIHAKPGDLSVLMGLGETYPFDSANKLETVEQLRWYQAAVAAHPRNAAVRNALGFALRSRGRLDAAIAEFREAITIDSKNVQARNNLGVALRAIGDLPGAIEQYKTALQIDPRFAPAYHNLGNALFSNKDPDGAIEAYKNALAIDPTLFRTHNNLGIVYDQTNESEKALQCYQAAIRANPKFAEAHNNLGLYHYRKKNYADAILEFRIAQNLDPKNNLNYINCALALRDSGNLQGAADDFRKAIELKPTDFYAHDALGNALYGLKKYDEAIACFKEAVRLEPRLEQAFFGMGNAYRDKGNLDEAVQAYREVIRIAPDSPRTLNSLAWILATGPDHLRNGKQAVQYALRSCELQKWPVSVVDTLAAAYAEAGDFAKAVEHQKKVTAAPNYMKSAQGPGALQRLKLYEEKKPYRDPKMLPPERAPAPRAGK